MIRACETQRQKLLRLLAGLLTAVAFMSVGPFSSALSRFFGSAILSVLSRALPEGAAGLKIESRVGTEILQSANTSDMMWPVAKTIATISEYTTLQPGDMIAMDTPPGVGHAKIPPRGLRPGETVEVEIEGIGICANSIIDEADA